MLRVGVLMCVVATSALFAGCERLFSALNESALESDVRTLLKGASVDAQQLRCHMAGATRQGACSLQLSPSEMQGIVTALALEPTSDAMTPRTPGALKAPDAWVTCGHQPGAALTTFGAGGRPATLRLSNGSAFQSLMVMRDPSGRACLLAEYSYG